MLIINANVAISANVISLGEVAEFGKINLIFKQNIMRNENVNEQQNQQSCQTAVMVSAVYKGYTFDEDNTGYAPQHLRFSFYTDDGETIAGSGESIEDCKQQIDEL